MKVYRITEKVEEFQSFVWDIQDDNLRKDTIMDCSRKGENWVLPTLEIDAYSDQFEKGDFFGLGGDSFVFNQKTLRSCETIFNNSGEILKFNYQGAKYFLLNITSCGQFLDEKKSEFVIGMRSGLPIRILRYEFKEEKILNLDLFKINFNKTLKFAVEDTSRETFKSIYDSQGYRGLEFELVWESK